MVPLAARSRSVGARGDGAGVLVTDFDPLRAGQGRPQAGARRKFDVDAGVAKVRTLR